MEGAGKHLRREEDEKGKELALKAGLNEISLELMSRLQARKQQGEQARETSEASRTGSALPRDMVPQVNLMWKLTFTKFT